MENVVFLVRCCTSVIFVVTKVADIKKPDGVWSWFWNRQLLFLTFFFCICMNENR